jgi:hypothetical protein
VSGSPGEGSLLFVAAGGALLSPPPFVAGVSRGGRSTPLRSFEVEASPHAPIRSAKVARSPVLVLMGGLDGSMYADITGQ